MKRLILVSWYGMNDVGGLERVTQYMYETWKDEYEIDLVSLDTLRAQAGLKKILVNSHYTIAAWVVSRYVNQLKKKYLKQGDSVKIITQNFQAPYVKADVAFAHGNMRAFKSIVCGGSCAWKPNQYFEMISYRKAARVVAVSQQVKKEVETYYGIEPTKIQVLENCVDTSLFTPADTLPEGDYKILFAGRLEYMKGLDTLTALADKIEQTEDMTLYIATQSTKNAEIFTKYKRSQVSTGLDRGAMIEFYRHGDMMFFPSRHEGFEMVTTECLSCGVPVMGNDIGAVNTLHNKGMEGVYIITDDLEKIRKICQTYRDKDKRQRLHELMKSGYDKIDYSGKLKALL